jgi:hypothetical protein
MLSLMGRRTLAGAAMAVALVCLAPGARAADARPWVQLTVAGPWDRGALEELLRHMRAELQAQQIDVYAPPQGNGEPIAFVQVTPNAGASNVDIAIDVRDALTSKRVGRNVDLTSIPNDGRALTIALAADELLRASWAELAFTAFSARRPRSTVAVPAGVTESVAGALRAPPRYPRARLALGPAGARYGGGQTHLGGELEVGLELSPRIAATLAAGFLWMRPTSTPDGDVQGFALRGTLGVAWTVTRPEARAGLDLTARLEAARVTFVPAANATAGATGATGSGIAVVAAGGPTGWLALRSNLRAFVGARAGFVLRPVNAWDREQVVTAVSGLGLMAQAGVTATF